MTLIRVRPELKPSPSPGRIRQFGFVFDTQAHNNQSPKDITRLELSVPRYVRLSSSNRMLLLKRFTLRNTAMIDGQRMT